MKKIFSNLFIAVLASGMVAGSALAKDFPDLSQSHWAYKQIQALSNDNVIVGYPSGIFKPDAPVTRAEFATMVIRALGQENAPIGETPDFKDITVDHWAYKNILRAATFDLIKGTDDGLFRPDDNISKAEAISIVIAAINTGELSVEKAQEVLSIYVDAHKIPDWAVVPAGKAEIIGITAHDPNNQYLFNPDQKISRAEISADLYNMREEAKHNPNAKLAEAMRIKTGEGYVIEGVTVDNKIATIPAGAKIPVVLTSALSSQNTDQGSIFVTKAEKNLVTKENYLLVVKDGKVNGTVSTAKPAKLFIRNGKLMLDTQNLYTTRGQKAIFEGNIDTKKKHNWFMKAVRFVIKGDKINLKDGQTVFIKLTKPVKIDLTNGWVIEK